MTAATSVWKRGAEVHCGRGDKIDGSHIIEHGVPMCSVRMLDHPHCSDRHSGDRASICGLPVYVVVLSRSPLTYAWADITLEQRRYILDHNLTPLQALWYLRLPAPMDQSA